MSDAWTRFPKAEDRLRELYSEGRSASKIALLLNTEFRGVFLTRNAIIGKLRRLGLMRREKPVGGDDRPVRTRRRRQSAAAPAVVEPEQPILEETLPPGHGCTLLDLTNTTCRWPYGDPATETFAYCGKPGADMIVGQPYCAGHRRTAGNPFARVMSDEERQRRALAYRRRMNSQHQEA